MQPVVRSVNYAQVQRLKHVALYYGTQSCRSISTSKPTTDASTYSPVKTFNQAQLPTGQAVKIFRPQLGKRNSIVKAQGFDEANLENSEHQELRPPLGGPRLSTPDLYSYNSLKPSMAESFSTSQAPDRLSGHSALVTYLRARGDKLEKTPQGMFSTVLCWVLRHAARDLGYEIVPDGFVRVSDMLRFEYFLNNNFTLGTFADFCCKDPFDRFEVMSLPDLVEGKLQDVWWVRARGGQTIPGVLSSNKRIINMGKLQTVVYRATIGELAHIQKYGITEGPDRLIRLYQRGGDLFHNIIPQHAVFVCITINAQKAADLGVKFFHTNTVELYALGDGNGIVPLEAIRSVVELEIAKEKLTWR